MVVCHVYILPKPHLSASSSGAFLCRADIAAGQLAKGMRFLEIK